MLIESKNLIFRGAPGTGKSYLAKEIAADIISNGYFGDYTLYIVKASKIRRFWRLNLVAETGQYTLFAAVCQVRQM